MGSMRQFPLLCYCFSWQSGDSKDLQGSYRKVSPLQGFPECIGLRSSGKLGPQCSESGIFKKWEIRTLCWPFAIQKRILRHHRRMVGNLGFLRAVTLLWLKLPGCPHRVFMQHLSVNSFLISWPNTLFGLPPHTFWVDRQSWEPEKTIGPQSKS